MDYDPTEPPTNLPDWYPKDELPRVLHILNNPSYQRDPLPASTVAALFGLTPSAIYNMARKPHTGVVRYPTGYDVWEVKRWLLTRNQVQAGRAETRRTSNLTPRITGV